jgi:UDP-N-acetylglucosamine 2-epimerase (non-hydrolysing)
MRQSIFIVGTRAQLVKVAPVLQVAVETGLEHIVWFTGQHNESIGDLIADFAIKSEFIHPKEHKERSSILRLLVWLPGTFYRCYRYVREMKSRTDMAPLVVVHGDTLSTFLGALAGRIASGRIVHLESGLSSGKLTDPFPEEILRRLTFRLTDLALCPNDDAFERMRKFRNCTVIHTGENTLLDCVRYALASLGNIESSHSNVDFVASIHRFQNIYNRRMLTSIVDELIGLAEIGTVHFILHPPTERKLKEYGLFERMQQVPGIRLRPRMAYTEFLALMGGARCVFSDGGSNQEELSYLGIPTVLFRSRSERPDGIGANIVLYSDTTPPMVEYVNSDAFNELRRDSRIHDSVQPSRTTVEALLDWATPTSQET